MLAMNCKILEPSFCLLIPLTKLHGIIAGQPWLIGLTFCLCFINKIYAIMSCFTEGYLGVLFRERCLDFWIGRGGWEEREMYATGMVVHSCCYLEEKKFRIMSSLFCMWLIYGGECSSHVPELCSGGTGLWDFLFLRYFDLFQFWNRISIIRLEKFCSEKKPTILCCYCTFQTIWIYCSRRPFQMRK